MEKIQGHPSRNRQLRQSARFLLPSQSMFPGEWTMPDYPEFPAQTGRENIVNLWVGAMEQFPGIMFEAWPGSIEVDGNTAKVRSYTAEVYDQGDNTVRDRGEYDDECVKIEGRWYFSRRAFRNIHKQIQPKGS